MAALNADGDLWCRQCGYVVSAAKAAGHEALLKAEAKHDSPAKIVKAAAEKAVKAVSHGTSKKRPRSRRVVKK